MTGWIIFAQAWKNKIANNYKFLSYINSNQPLFILFNSARDVI